MQKVNTFDTAFEARKTADDRAAQVAGLGRAIRDVWARLLELSTSERAVEATHEAESQIADDGPGIFANFYDGARERVKAGEPVVSFSKLVR
jgi:hypothetical protein